MAERCPTCRKQMVHAVVEKGVATYRCLDCERIDPMKTDVIKLAHSLQPPN